MKKTLLALAAIAASTASFAQSSVTLYGVVDVSLESVKGDKTVTRVSSSNFNSSRIGFKGTEDIGGGLKANFALESAVAVDTGAAGTNSTTANTRFFDRAAWVGLAGGFGDVRLGRIDTLIGDVAGVAAGVGPQAYDALKIVGARGGDSLRRTDNAVTYFLPTMVPGLSAGLQYATAAGSGTTVGTETVGENTGKSFGLNVKYAAGPLSAGIGYINLKDDAKITATGDQKANATLIYGGYDFGAAKATLYYDAETDPNNVGGRRMSVLGTTINVPFSPEYTVVIGAAQARNVNGVAGSAAGDDNVEIISLKGIYNLSKRTAVYGLFTNVNNGDLTKKGILAPTVADTTTHGLAVGVRHNF